MRLIGFAPVSARVSAGMTVTMFATLICACGPDLGMCDKDAAERVIYLSDGTPYFEGQALMHQSCAGSQCHADGAVGAARTGAPHGLNFDVQPLTSRSTTDGLPALRFGIGKVREEKEELWSQIESGAMPPGDVGDRRGLAWRADPEGQIDAMLPSVSTDRGKDKLRNWLACGSPLVSAASDSPAASGAKLIGVVMDPGTSSTTATFDSVYDGILASCASCHMPGSAFPTQALDLSSKDSAFTNLVNKDAFTGGACAGRKLVVPGDCEGSLLYQKLLPAGEAMNLCGGPMPLGGTPIADPQLAALCEWIDAGALRQ